jgi:hypothetical protein
MKFKIDLNILRINNKGLVIQERRLMFNFRSKKNGFWNVFYTIISETEIQKISILCIMFKAVFSIIKLQKADSRERTAYINDIIKF